MMSNDKPQIPPQISPAEIERRSFAMIEQELPHALDPVQAPVIKRVIHTTADFSYADTLRFSAQAVEAWRAIWPDIKPSSE